MAINAICNNNGSNSIPKTIIVDVTAAVIISPMTNYYYYYITCNQGDNGVKTNNIGRGRRNDLSSRARGINNFGWSVSACSNSKRSG